MQGRSETQGSAMRCPNHPSSGPESGNERRRNGPSAGAVGLSIILALSAVLSTQTAQASGRFFTKTVRRGETAKGIAQYYYGNPAAAPVVRAVAEMAPFQTRRLKPGLRLRLPVAWSYRIRPGDTWTQLGRDYLSAGFRGRLLALINGKSPTKRPPVGHVLRIPATLWYKPSRPLPMRRLVRWLAPAVEASEQKQLAERIATFNGLSGTKLRRNKMVLIPLFSLQARQGLVANDLPIPDPRTVRELKRTHAAAKALLGDGRYEQAVSVCLGRIADAHLAPRQGALLYKDLAQAFVAQDWIALARTMAAKALKLDPKLPLDPLHDSPKVLRLFEGKTRPSSAAHP